MGLPSPLEKGDHEVVDEVCFWTAFPSPPLRGPSPRRGLGGVRWAFPSPPLRGPSPRRGLGFAAHKRGLGGV